MPGRASPVPSSFETKRSVLATKAVAALGICSPFLLPLSHPASAQTIANETSRADALTMSATPDASSARADDRTSTFLGEGTSISLGLGANIAPAYQGAKKMRGSPFPYFEVKGLLGGRVFLSITQGLGVNIVDTGPFKAGLSLGYGGGRDSSDSSRLKGLSNVNGGLTPSAFMTYEVKPFSAEFKVGDTLGPNPGTQAEFGLSYAARPLPRLNISVGPHVTWADRRYDKAYFGVSPAAAARATAEGNPLTAYSPGSGIKDVGLSFTGVYQITRHWGAIGRIGLTQLVGSPAKDSPLTQHQFQPSVSFGALYRF